MAKAFAEGFLLIVGVIAVAIGAAAILAGEL